MSHFRRPLVAALAAFLFGLTATLRFALPTVPPAELLAGVAIVVAGALASRPVRRSSVAFLLVLFLPCGALLGELARRENASDCRSNLADGSHLELRGSLGAAHRPVRDISRPPLLPLLGASAPVIPGCSGEFRIRLDPSHPAVFPGTEVMVVGEWRSFGSPVSPSPWPRDPGFRGFLKADSLVVLGRPPPRTAPLMAIRARADAAFARLFPDHQAMVEALLLGRREYVDPLVTERFNASGLTHLLAISGSHVALFAGILLLLGPPLGLSRRASVAVSLAGMWIYLLVIGAPASALRAGCMMTLILFGTLLQRPSAAGPVMALAAFVILAIRPLSILDPGFQLSFLGVLGIVVLKPRLAAMLPGWLPRKGPAGLLLDGLLVGLAAFITTAPAVAHHFGIVAPVSILAGVPAVPPTSLALVGTTAALALEPLGASLARLLADGSALTLDLLGRIAAVAAAIPYGHAPIPPPPWWAWGAALMVGLTAARLPALRAGQVRSAMGWGAAGLTLLVWPIAAGAAAEGLEVHFLDVGQGDAVALRTPRDHWIVVDAGPASDDFDAGQRRVIPFLLEHRASRVDLLVLTHPHLDHIGGAPALLNRMDVDVLIEPGAALGIASYLELLRAVEASETEWQAARSGRTLTLDGVRLDFLWPDPETVDATEDANQISAVVRVSYGGFSLLLTGDIGAEVESILLRRHGASLQADVLKLAHHGSATSTSPAFLDAVQPELAVASAGRRNSYGHPAPSVLSALHEREIALARTDRDGTVSIEVPAGGDTWRRLEW